MIRIIKTKKKYIYWDKSNVSYDNKTISINTKDGNQQANTY